MPRPRPESLFARCIIGACFGLLAAFWMYTVKLYWFANTPEEQHFYGYLQGDQKTYDILIRSAVKAPFCLFYAYPWDYSADPPHVFFQIPITLMSWLARSFPSAALHDVFDLFRAIFAAGMFAALAALLHQYFPRRIPFLSALWIASLGGGIAWFTAFFSGGGMGYLINYYNAENMRYWWFLCVFRNIMYPFEVYYHLLFFMCAIFIIRRRFLPAAALLPLGLFSNPFLGTQMGAMLLPALVVEFMLRPRERRRLVAAVVIAIGAAGAFIWYYSVFLPAYPVANSILKQHKGAYSDPLSLRSAVLAYTPWIWIACASLFFRGFMRRQLKSRKGRLLAVWLASSLLLASNSRFLSNPVQPMHFTRGYIYLPCVIWAVQFITFMLRGRNIALLRGRTGTLLLVAVCLLTVPDNAVFVAHRYRTELQYEFVGEETQELLNHFRGRDGLAVVDSLQEGIHLHTYGGFPVVCGDHYTTPYYEDRIHEWSRFYDSNDFRVFRFHQTITAFIVDRERHDEAVRQIPSYYRRILGPHGFGQTFINGKFVVYERRPPGA